MKMGTWCFMTMVTPTLTQLAKLAGKRLRRALCVLALTMSLMAWREVCGEAVNEKLATIVNNVGVNKMSETRMKEQLENIKRPENFKYLAVTKVNPEIWSKLSQPTRSRDLKFQKVQNALMKGISAVVQATHALYESLQKPDDSTLDVCSVVKLLTEGSALILDANLELNFRRRESMLPDWNSRYKQLCSTHLPFTTLLFGDELTQQVKNINETNKVGIAVTGGGNFGRGNGRRLFGNRGNFNSRGRGFFAGWRLPGGGYNQYN
jgi:hypothetical protein